MHDNRIVFTRVGARTDYRRTEVINNSVKKQKEVSLRRMGAEAEWTFLTKRNWMNNLNVI